MIEKMKKWIKNKAGVSPIIAIILMVAITVVLAATIYVWVSGMGKTGGATPNLSGAVDNINDKLTITAAESGMKWKDVRITYVADEEVNISVYYANGTIITQSPATNTSAGQITFTNDIAIQAGDYIKVADGGETGTATYVDLTIVYIPTNTNLGTWRIYI